MQTIEYHDTQTIENPRREKMADWLSGVWDEEPDRRYWVNEHNQPCLILRGPLGALCGYVAVPPGHQYHGADMSALWDADIDAHGGITYAAPCQEHAPEGEGICHVPQPGEPDDVWWIGFDCAHAWDLTPGGMALGDETYRTISYVQSEVERLAGQLR